MIINILIIIVGFYVLIRGASLLVDGSSNIAKKLGIPELIIGLTIVSIGTSMPELFVSVTSALHNQSDISLGNVIGSNICNLLLILGVAAILNPVKFNKQTKKIDVPICIFITSFFLIFANTGKQISRIEGGILFVLFVLFLGYTIKSAKENKTKRIVDKNIKILPNLFYMITGIILLKFGGDFVVGHSTIVANRLGISDKIISLTIIAIGTSLPELVTTVTASLKGTPDIAMGNILGSNIFNFLLIGGLSAIISPINYNQSYNLQMGILLVSSIVLSIFPYTDKKDEMTVSNGITFLMLFSLYTAMLFYI